MKPIVPPISRAARGAAATNLQAGLVLLLQRSVIRLSEEERRALETGLRQEKSQHVYGGRRLMWSRGFSNSRSYPSTTRSIRLPQTRDKLGWMARRI